MKLFDVYPLMDLNIVRADGAYVYDEADHAFLDLYGGHAVISIGHGHPHWKQRIKAQMDKISFYSNAVINELQTELAEKLATLSGKEDYQLFLCNSGAEANENALKLASFHTGRKQIVAFRKAFHGRTSLAVAATDSPKYSAPVNETGNVVFLPFNDTTALKEYFKTNGQEVAAVIIEGIQGVGGIHVASDEFLHTIRQLCDAHQAVFIADEVQCGYGRSGKFFSTDHAALNADIYTMAKGMGNGFPVAGILIAPHFKAQYGMLGTTFGGNHLACAAALAVLETMEQEDLVQNAAAIGDYLLHALRQVAGIENVRGKGLMIGFDVPESSKGLKQQLFQKYRILTGEAGPNVIRLLPGLSIDHTIADTFLQALQAAIDDVKN